MVKIGINGFGRIGRLAFRKIFEDEKFEVAAVNDLAETDMLAYLLKYDSVQGTFCHEVDSDEENIIVDGRKIRVCKEHVPAKLPWSALGVDIVLECTGFFASKCKAQAHLDAGAGKVIISAPAGNDLPTIVYGVNESILTENDNIISAASCTTNCLAPMAKALNDHREIVTGFMTTIHAYTGDQMILDGPHRKNDFRRARAGAVNIVPNSTGAAKAIGLVIPELEGKLTGSAQRVPVAAGSTAVLTAVLRDPDGTVTVEGINRAMKDAGNETFGYTEEEIVSSDVIGISYGSLFDATQTFVEKFEDGLAHVQVTAWYDNEMSYVFQMIRTMGHAASLL